MKILDMKCIQWRSQLIYIPFEKTNIHFVISKIGYGYFPQYVMNCIYRGSDLPVWSNGKLEVFFANRDIMRQYELVYEADYDLIMLNMAIFDGLENFLFFRHPYNMDKVRREFAESVMDYDFLT